MRSDEGSTAVAVMDPENVTNEQEQEQQSAEAQAEELSRLRKRQQRENEIVTVIFKTREEITQQEVVIDGEKGKLKLMEAKLDKLNQELCEIVRGQGDTLFDGVENKAEGPGAVTPTPEEDESWRRVPIANIGFKPKHVEKLQAKELTTLGALADWMSAGQNRLTDIDGVGPAAQEEMEDVLATYWANNPRKPKANPANEAIIVPFDIGLNREEIIGANCCDLADQLNDGSTPTVDALKAKIGEAEKLFLNVGHLDPETGEETAPGDKPSHRLIPLYTPDEFKAVAPTIGEAIDDKLVGMKVKVGRKAYVCGPRSESLLVSVGE